VVRWLIFHFAGVPGFSVHKPCQAIWGVHPIDEARLKEQKSQHNNSAIAVNGN
jgi:hypothetical protein